MYTITSNVDILERDKLLTVTFSTRSKGHHMKPAEVRMKIEKTEAVFHMMSS